MTQPPPALANPPQFSADYWDKAPKAMIKCKIARLTNMPNEEFLEFVFDNDEAFQRRKSELDPEMVKLLHANLEVFVQTFQGQLVTGLFIPEHGWVFKMTGQQLADYAKKLTTAIHNQRQQARQSIVEHVAAALEVALCARGVNADSKDGNIELSYELAAAAITALEGGPQA